MSWSARCAAPGIAVGHDFHFGRGREGTPAVLEELCRANGLDCTVVPAVVESGCIVSSSAIRAALEGGDVALANRLLGYRWFVRADVRRGDARGRTLGYLTANLRLGDDCRLRHGIYAVRAILDGRPDRRRERGRRPTFDNGAPLLEVHLFDFAGSSTAASSTWNSSAGSGARSGSTPCRPWSREWTDSDEARRMLADDRTHRPRDSRPRGLGGSRPRVM